MDSADSSTSSRRPQRVETDWTRPLQYLVASWYVLLVLQNLIGILIDVTGHGPKAIVVGGKLIPSAGLETGTSLILLAWSLVDGLLALGAIRRWRWTFWVALVFNAIGVLNVFAAPRALADAMHPSDLTDPSAYAVLNAVVDLLDPIVFAAMLLALISIGVWATRKLQTNGQATL